MWECVSYLCLCPGIPATAVSGPVCLGTRWCRIPESHTLPPEHSGSQTPWGWRRSHSAALPHPENEGLNWRLRRWTKNKKEINEWRKIWIFQLFHIPWYTLQIHLWELHRAEESQKLYMNSKYFFLFSEITVKCLGNVNSSANMCP